MSSHTLIALAACCALASPALADPPPTPPTHFDVFSVDDLKYYLSQEQERIRDHDASRRIDDFLKRLEAVERDLRKSLSQARRQGGTPSGRSTSRLRYLVLRPASACPRRVIGTGDSREPCGYGLFIHDLDHTPQGELTFADLTSIDEEHDRYVHREVSWFWEDFLQRVTDRAGIAFKGEAMPPLRESWVVPTLDRLHAKLTEDPLHGTALGFLRAAEHQSFLVLAGRGEGRYGVGTVQVSRTGAWYRLKNTEAARQWSAFGDQLIHLMKESTLRAHFVLSLTHIGDASPDDSWATPESHFQIHHDDDACLVPPDAFRSSPRAAPYTSGTIISRNCLTTGFHVELTSTPEGIDLLWEGEAWRPGERRPLTPVLSEPFSDRSPMDVYFALRPVAVPLTRLQQARERCDGQLGSLREDLDGCTTNRGVLAERARQMEDRIDALTEEHGLTTEALTELELDLLFSGGFDFEVATSMLQKIVRHFDLSSDERRRETLLKPLPSWEKLQRRRRLPRAGSSNHPNRKAWRHLNEQLLTLWILLRDRCTQLQQVWERQESGDISYSGDVYLSFAPRPQDRFLAQYVERFLNHDTSVPCRVTTVRQRPIEPIRQIDISIRPAILDD